MFSVPAVMVPQQALAIEPEQLRSLAACNDSQAAADRASKLADEVRALADRVQNGTGSRALADDARATDDAPATDLTVEQRLSVLESKIETLTRTLEGLVPPNR
jgi:hypothetical protein